MFACRDVESRANNYLLERFEYVCKTEEFLKLSVAEVEHFLNMDDVIVKSEESIFECILRWIQKDPLDRADHFDRLVRCVRFPLVPDHYLETEILPSELVQKSKECQQLILESQLMRRRRRYNAVSLVPAPADSTACSSAGNTPRQPQYRGSNQLLFLQCSNTSPWLKTPPVLYDFKKSCWSTLGGPHSPCRYREDSTFVFHNGSVLAVGGEYTNDGTEGGNGGLPLVGGGAHGVGGQPMVGGAPHGSVQVLLGKN